ncbi:hypothetical protein MRB53_013287 [Persea americana]|uniref:Uncharacterized protein n=1 Tax=Persea americana TaxID=3435 RepID=A0ACC2K7L0_PERAE|nr:hypothetical protein MRB53_013287 [Persea americana]
MDNNLLEGTIPMHLMKLNKLQVLVLGGNRLSGKIPIPIGNLTQVYFLELSRNNFKGSIPRSLGECQHLQYLNLSVNNLNGTIPNEFSDIPSLLELYIDMNNLTGFLPSDIGKLKNLFRLDISNNKLSGEIPDTLGTCVRLEYLYMKGNLFHGSILPSLGDVRGLLELDLSCNNLTGHVQGDLALLPFLEYLNFSFNNLEGEVPKQGIFQNASAVSILGNNKLCGGISELQLPQCPKKDYKKKPLSRKVIILVAVVAALFSFLLLCVLVVRSKKPREKLLSTLSMGENFLRVTYAELFRATSGFSSANLIGVESYGSIYRGIIDRMEMIVAIKALVLEYMPNGSLDGWLHPSANELQPLKNLNLIQRLNLAIDIACALDYLHNHCRPPIVHCDLKPSNILLDDDMVAHVSDFGLATIISEDRRLLSEQTEIIRHNGNNNRVSSMMHECLVSLAKIGVSCSAESPKALKEMKDVIAELQKVRDSYLAATAGRNV